MPKKSWSSVDLAVAGLGVALVVFFAGVTASIAAGQTPPTALWAAGGAVAGALTGLLVPAPGTKRAHVKAAEVAQATARTATAEATAAGERMAAALAGPAAPAVVAVHKAQVDAAATVAQTAALAAAEHTATAASIPETKGAALALLGFFVLLLALGIVLAGGAIVPPGAFLESLKNVTAAVIALASASGSALIGLLAPNPRGG